MAMDDELVNDQNLVGEETAPRLAEEGGPLPSPELATPELAVEGEDPGESQDMFALPEGALDPVEDPTFEEDSSPLADLSVKRPEDLTQADMTITPPEGSDELSISRPELTAEQKTWFDDGPKLEEMRVGDLLTDRQLTMEAQRLGKKGFTERLKEEFSDNLVSKIPFVGGVLSPEWERRKLFEAKERALADPKRFGWSLDQEKRLNSLMNRYRLDSARGTSWGGIAASALANLPTFALEFMIMKGLIGTRVRPGVVANVMKQPRAMSAKAAARAIPLSKSRLKAMATRLAKIKYGTSNPTPNMIRNMSHEVSTRMLTKSFAARQLVNLTEASAFLPAMEAMSLRNYAERMTPVVIQRDDGKMDLVRPQKDATRELVFAHVDTFIELFSEQLGTDLSILGKKMFRPITKRAAARMRKPVGEAITEYASRAAADNPDMGMFSKTLRKVDGEHFQGMMKTITHQIGKFSSATEIHNMPEEMGEEWIGAIARSVLNVDQGATDKDGRPLSWGERVVDSILFPVTHFKEFTAMAAAFSAMPLGNGAIAAIRDAEQRQIAANNRNLVNAFIPISKKLSEEGADPADIVQLAAGLEDTSRKIYVRLMKEDGVKWWAKTFFPRIVERSRSQTKYLRPGTMAHLLSHLQQTDVRELAEKEGEAGIRQMMADWYGAILVGDESTMETLRRGIRAGKLFFPGPYQLGLGEKGQIVRKLMVDPEYAHEFEDEKVQAHLMMELADGSSKAIPVVTDLESGEKYRRIYIDLEETTTAPLFRAFQKVAGYLGGKSKVRFTMPAVTQYAEGYIGRVDATPQSVTAKQLFQIRGINSNGIAYFNRDTWVTDAYEEALETRWKEIVSDQKGNYKEHAALIELRGLLVNRLKAVKKGYKDRNMDKSIDRAIAILNAKGYTEHHQRELLNKLMVSFLVADTTVRQGKVNGTISAEWSDLADFIYQDLAVRDLVLDIGRRAYGDAFTTDSASGFIEQKSPAWDAWQRSLGMGVAEREISDIEATEAKLDYGEASDKKPTGAAKLKAAAAKKAMSDEQTKKRTKDYTPAMKELDAEINEQHSRAVGLLQASKEWEKKDKVHSLELEVQSMMARIKEHTATIELVTLQGGDTASIKSRIDVVNERLEVVREELKQARAQAALEAKKAKKEGKGKPTKLKVSGAAKLRGIKPSKAAPMTAEEMELMGIDGSEEFDNDFEAARDFNLAMDEFDEMPDTDFDFDYSAKEMYIDPKKQTIVTDASIPFLFSAVRRERELNEEIAEREGEDAENMSALVMRDAADKATVLLSHLAEEMSMSTDMARMKLLITRMRAETTLDEAVTSEEKFKEYISKPLPDSAPSADRYIQQLFYGIRDRVKYETAVALNTFIKKSTFTPNVIGAQAFEAGALKGAVGYRQRKAYSYMDDHLIDQMSKIILDALRYKKVTKHVKKLYEAFDLNTYDREGIVEFVHMMTGFDKDWLLEVSKDSGEVPAMDRNRIVFHKQVLNRRTNQWSYVYGARGTSVVDPSRERKIEDHDNAFDLLAKYLLIALRESYKNGNTDESRRAAWIKARNAIFKTSGQLKKEELVGSVISNLAEHFTQYTSGVPVMRFKSPEKRDLNNLWLHSQFTRQVLSDRGKGAMKHHLSVFPGVWGHGQPGQTDYIPSRDALNMTDEDMKDVLREFYINGVVSGTGEYLAWPGAFAERKTAWLLNVPVYYRDARGNLPESFLALFRAYESQWKRLLADQERRAEKKILDKIWEASGFRGKRSDWKLNADGRAKAKSQAYAVAADMMTPPEKLQPLFKYLPMRGKATRSDGDSAWKARFAVTNALNLFYINRSFIHGEYTRYKDRADMNKRSATALSGTHAPDTRLIGRTHYNMVIVDDATFTLPDGTQIPVSDGSVYLDAKFADELVKAYGSIAGAARFGDPHFMKLLHASLAGQKDRNLVKAGFIVLRDDFQTNPVNNAIREWMNKYNAEVDKWNEENPTAEPKARVDMVAFASGVKVTGQKAVTMFKKGAKQSEQLDRKFNGFTPDSLSEALPISDLGFIADLRYQMDIAPWPDMKQRLSSLGVVPEYANEYVEGRHEEAKVRVDNYSLPKQLASVDTSRVPGLERAKTGQEPWDLRHEGEILPTLFSKFRKMVTAVSNRAYLIEGTNSTLTGARIVGRTGDGAYQIIEQGAEELPPVTPFKLKGKADEILTASGMTQAEMAEMLGYNMPSIEALVGELEQASQNAKTQGTGRAPKRDERGDIIEWTAGNKFYPDGWDGKKLKQLKSAIKNVKTKGAATAQQWDTLEDAVLLIGERGDPTSREEEAIVRGLPTETRVRVSRTNVRKAAGLRATESLYGTLSNAADYVIANIEDYTDLLDMEKIEEIGITWELHPNGKMVLTGDFYERNAKGELDYSKPRITPDMLLLHEFEVDSDLNIVYIPGSLVELVRVPSEDARSHMLSRIDQFLPESSGMIEVSPEDQVLRGSDNDGDKLFMITDGYALSLLNKYVQKVDNFEKMRTQVDPGMLQELADRMTKRVSNPSLKYRAKWEFGSKHTYSPYVTTSPANSVTGMLADKLNGLMGKEGLEIMAAQNAGVSMLINMGLHVEGGQASDIPFIGVDGKQYHIHLDAADPRKIQARYSAMKAIFGNLLTTYADHTKNPIAQHVGFTPEYLSLLVYLVWSNNALLGETEAETLKKHKDYLETLSQMFLSEPYVEFSRRIKQSRNISIDQIYESQIRKEIAAEYGTAGAQLDAFLEKAKYWSQLIAYARSYAAGFRSMYDLQVADSVAKAQATNTAPLTEFGYDGKLRFSLEKGVNKIPAVAQAIRDQIRWTKEELLGEGGMKLLGNSLAARQILTQYGKAGADGRKWAYSGQAALREVTDRLRTIALARAIARSTGLSLKEVTDKVANPEYFEKLREKYPTNEFIHALDFVEGTKSDLKMVTVKEVDEDTMETYTRKKPQRLKQIRLQSHYLTQQAASALDQMMLLKRESSKKELRSAEGKQVIRELALYKAATTKWSLVGHDFNFMEFLPDWFHDEMTDEVAREFYLWNNSYFTEASIPLVQGYLTGKLPNVATKSIQFLDQDGLSKEFDKKLKEDRAKAIPLAQQDETTMGRTEKSFSAMEMQLNYGNGYWNLATNLLDRMFPNVRRIMNKLRGNKSPHAAATYADLVKWYNKQHKRMFNLLQAGLTLPDDEGNGHPAMVQHDEKFKKEVEELLAGPMSRKVRANLGYLSWKSGTQQDSKRKHHERIRKWAADTLFNPQLTAIEKLEATEKMVHSSMGGAKYDPAVRQLINHLEKKVPKGFKAKADDYATPIDLVHRSMSAVEMKLVNNTRLTAPLGNNNLHSFLINATNESGVLGTLAQFHGKAYYTRLKQAAKRAKLHIDAVDQAMFFDIDNSPYMVTARHLGQDEKGRKKFIPAWIDPKNGEMRLWVKPSEILDQLDPQDRKWLRTRGRVLFRALRKQANKVTSGLKMFDELGEYLANRKNYITHLRESYDEGGLIESLNGLSPEDFTLDEVDVSAGLVDSEDAIKKHNDAIENYWEKLEKAVAEGRAAHNLRDFREESGRAKRRKYDTAYELYMNTGVLLEVHNVAVAAERWANSVGHVVRNKVFIAHGALFRDAQGRSPYLLGVPADSQRTQLLSQSMAKDMLLNAVSTIKSITGKKEIRINNAADPWAEMEKLLSTHTNALLDNGYVRVSMPQGSNIRTIFAREGDPARLLKHITSKGFQDIQNPLIRFVLTKTKMFNHTTKKLALGLSGFHFFALLESVVSSYGFVKGGAIMHRSFWRALKLSLGGKLATDNFALEILNPTMRAADWTATGLTIGGPSLDMAKADSIDKWLDGVTKVSAKDSFIKKGARIPAAALKEFKSGADGLLWGRILPVFKLTVANEILSQAHASMEYTHVNEKVLMQDIANFVNGIFGGRVWEQMIWANPMARDIMQLLVFAPDWTLSAINTTMVPEVIKDITGIPGGIALPFQTNMGYKQAYGKYWPAFVAIITFALPNALQAAIFAAFGDPEKGDKPFMHMNEESRRSYMDWTPLFRQLGGKYGVTKLRRVYVKFGKQGWENLAWVKHPVRAGMGKSSMAIKVAMEQLVGKNSGWYDTPWKRSGTFGLFEVNGDFFDSRTYALISKFVPISVASLLSGQPTTFFAPARLGHSKTEAEMQMVPALLAYSQADFEAPYHDGMYEAKQRLYDLNSDILEAVRLNGYPPEDVLSTALGRARGVLYLQIYNELERSKLLGGTRDRKLKQYVHQLRMLNSTIPQLWESLHAKIGYAGQRIDPTLWDKILELWWDEDAETEQSDDL